jgi:hypothetical protein
MTGLSAGGGGILLNRWGNPPEKLGYLLGESS